MHTLALRSSFYPRQEVCDESKRIWNCDFRPFSLLVFCYEAAAVSVSFSDYVGKYGRGVEEVEKRLHPVAEMNKNQREKRKRRMSNSTWYRVAIIVLIIPVY